MQFRMRMDLHFGSDLSLVDWNFISYGMGLSLEVILIEN